MHSTPKVGFQGKEIASMKMNEQSAIFIIDVCCTNVVNRLAEESGKKTTDVLRDFMKTKTCRLLFNPDSYLYLESPEYVLDMIDAEQQGDWKRWAEV
jgi:hypothetical protein